jgi:hypothetical protein
MLTRECSIRISKSALGGFATVMTSPQSKERAMATELHGESWIKRIIVRQKAPLKLKEVWAIRMRPQLALRENSYGSRLYFWVV